MGDVLVGDIFWAVLAVKRKIMSDFIETTKGLLSLADLSKEETSEKVPCGICITTKFLHEGELVRQDIRIEVEKGLLFAGLTKN